MFVYSSTEPFKGPVDLSRADGTKNYMVHYENLLTLEFIQKSTDNRDERAQCEKEMEIGRRKLAFWERHHNFVRAEADRRIAELKKKWAR